MDGRKAPPTRQMPARETIKSVCPPPVLSLEKLASTPGQCLGSTTVLPGPKAVQRHMLIAVGAEPAGRADRRAHREAVLHAFAAGCTLLRGGGRFDHQHVL